MEMSDILKMGTELFQNKLGDQASDMDSSSITDALSGLLSNNEGGFDMGNIVSQISNGDLGSIVSSWLGDGENEAISQEQLLETFGEEKVEEFASKIGTDKESALSGLTEALPNIVDKSSSGGSLLDSLGGLDNIMGMAGKLFGR